jgi:hypothetical protein
MGIAVRSVERLAVCSDHRQTEHCHWLAPQQLPSVLDLESPSRPTGPAGGVERNPPFDSEDDRENPFWGAPRIHGELLKLGIDVGETSVGKYLVRHRKPPSQTSRTFLENHVKSMVSWTSSRVPTISFRVLYVFLVLAHNRRPHRPLQRHRSSHREWTAQQLREAFPFDQVRNIFFVAVTASLAVSSAKM